MMREDIPRIAEENESATTPFVDAAAGVDPSIVAGSPPDEGDGIGQSRILLRVPRTVIAVGGLAMVGLLLSMIWTQQAAQPIPGPIVADHDTHLITSVRSDTAISPVRFLLQPRGAPLVTEVSTNLECASARLVQVDQVSAWFGIGSQAGQASADIQLLPYQPVYLEVRIEPGLHGPDSDVTFGHDVLVKTADGQVLSFLVETDGTGVTGGK